MYKLSNVRRKRLITDLDWCMIYFLSAVIIIIGRLGVVYG